MKRIVLGLVLLGACGGDEKKEPTATERCEVLRGTACTRAVDCANGPTRAECEASFDEEIPCGKAIAVSVSYDSCIEKLTTWPCNKSFGSADVALPADCKGVILFPEGTNE